MNEKTIKYLLKQFQMHSRFITSSQAFEKVMSENFLVLTSSRAFPLRHIQGSHHEEAIKKDMLQEICDHIREKEERCLVDQSFNTESLGRTNKTFYRSLILCCDPKE